MEGFFKDVIGVSFTMKYIRKAAGCALLLVTVVSHAGFYGNTAHSRGNCMGFNESITWNWSEYHWWEVESVHFLVLADVVREEYNANPMIEGNTRVQELMDWERDHPGEMPPLTEQEKYEFFTKKGMPVPGGGANVVDSTKGMTFAQSAAVNKFNSDQKTKGYHEQKNTKARLLLAMPETAEKEYSARKSIAFNPQDTHLYEVKSNLPMSYTFKGVPSALATKVIGYAPEATFVKNGWSGAVEFFVPTFGGVCAYHEKNIKLTKTAAFIPKEIATHMVNNKLTTMNAVGNKESGFVYEVEWWDKKFKRNLECAAKNYSEATAKATIELAKKIDS